MFYYDLQREGQICGFNYLQFKSYLFHRYIFHGSFFISKPCVSIPIWQFISVIDDKFQIISVIIVKHMMADYI